MPIADYGVIKGSVQGFTPGSDQFTHFQLILENPETGDRYQADINVRSKDGSEVLYYCNTDYSGPFVNQLSESLQYGYTPLSSIPNSLAVDYLRSGLFNTSKMVPLGMESPKNDDLNAFIGAVMSKAKASSDAVVYIFGQYFNDSGNQKQTDMQQGKPSQGIHDIHMNQGNFGSYERDNGTYQDGAIFVSFPSENNFQAIFLAFQTQSFQTNERGNPTGPSWAQVHGGEKYGK